ncbi:DUF3352 domain-containing protein [Fulvivirgaceae bacterium BMA12]|uniref:DUF3352 domain-containing protein n=1 Tax=Agaribacillus aureus TaxID=3051825 RepID=A0ABT8L0E8_9BACT|nr:DUF3352 domain-containing protein [Fulvivirgaceae bacterium BMA12]
MVKKILFRGLLIAIVASIGWAIYTFLFLPDQGLRPIYLVPGNAVYIIETEEPVSNWEAISQSEVWAHLQSNDYIADLTSNANSLDTLFKHNKMLFKLLGSRSLVISAHMYKRDDYDFLFVVDLQKVSKLTQLKDYLSAVLSNNYKVSRRTYHNREIIELYDKESRETIYMAFVENLLAVSYTHLLIEAAIDEVAEPVIGRDLHFIEINKKVDQDEMFRLFFQYKYLDDYLGIYMEDINEYVKSLSETLLFSGFTFELDANNLLIANGHTNIKEDSLSYLHVLQASGKGKISIPEIAPQRTAFYFSLGFDSFGEFYENLETLQKKNPVAFEGYSENYQKIEKLLKIDIRKHFISWIDDEIAFLQMQNSGLGTKNEFALVLKARDGDEALENLNIILKQIRKKTPVKFKQVTYKGYPINFMSIKGFFKLLLGKFFDDLEKPYFSVIDDYVVFSNHPQTIKNIINDYNLENTLSRSVDFKSFKDQFDNKSNLFAYINTPVLHGNLKSWVNNETSTNLDRNKRFITCFSQMGFQLVPSGNMFESKLLIQYQDPQQLEQKIQFAQKPEQLMLESFGKILEEPADFNLSNQVLLNMVEEEELIKAEEISPEDLDSKTFKEYYDSGELKIEVPLKDGMKHGTYREYHANGNIKLKGKYRRDRQVGIWKAYDENGNTIERKRL